MICSDRSDFNTYVINGCGCLGKITALDLANRLDNNLKIILVDDRVEYKYNILNSEKTEEYKTITLKELIEKKLCKNIQVSTIQKKYSGEVEENLKIKPKERLLINCRENKDKSINSIKMFFTSNKTLNLSLSNCPHPKETYEININLNNLKYAINLTNTVITNISYLKYFFSFYKGIPIKINLENIGEGKRYIENIIERRRMNGSKLRSKGEF